MKFIKTISLFLFVAFLATSCISKKQYAALQTDLDACNKDLSSRDGQLAELTRKLNACNQAKARMEAEVNKANSNTKLREEQIKDLKDQIADIRSQRDKQMGTVDDLTKMSTSANDNIKETLAQLERKDKYIQYVQTAKTRADSINLALSANLKGVLAQGIADQDVDVTVDKTVVFINLSDKMLYQSGSSTLTTRANEVLGKIAEIVKSRPEFEVMVEGYTDNVPMNSACIKDNWDLSVKRATSVVRALQTDYNIDPNRLIAAGRGEYNALASNDTAAGRSTNRRTRIIILPKLNQFYDLLDPDKAAVKLD